MPWLQIPLDALLPPSCAACDAPTSSPLCARCLEHVEAAPRDTLACAYFGGPLANALRAAKFARDITRAAALGRFWCDRIKEGACAALPPVDAITFVSAHWRRRIARGFDMPAVLASALSRAHGIPLVDAVRTLRCDPPLSFGADRAMRQLAVAGRYRARADVKGHRLLLVDDVRTTGATLAEASRVLTEAGAHVEVAPFTIAP